MKDEVVSLVEQHNDKIRQANGMFGACFPKGVILVSESLEEVRRLMSTDDFAKWARDEWDWSVSRTYHLTADAKLIRAMMDAGLAEEDLPAKESWCRELVTLPPEVVIERWPAFLAEMRAARRKVVAATVRDWVRQQRADDQAEDTTDDAATTSEGRSANTDTPKAAVKYLKAIDTLEKLLDASYYDIIPNIEREIAGRRLRELANVTEGRRVRVPAGSHRKVVLETLRKGPAMVHEISERCGLSSHDVGKRLSELAKDGDARRTGEKRRSPKGRGCDVWEAISVAPEV